MKISLIEKLFILVIVLILFCILGAGCFGDSEQLLGSPADEFAALLVPDTNLELYVYIKQEGPTMIPAKIINMPYDVKVESMALWGLPSDKSLVFGAGFTFANANDAAEIYSRIILEENTWKSLHDNKIYIIQGKGAAAESLKSAILNNGFKYYTNGDVLKAVAMMPRIGRTKIVAIGVAKPSEQILDFATDLIGKENFSQVSRILKLLSVDMLIGGLYSPHQINVSKAVEMFEKGNSASALDVGMLVLIKSNLPAFVVEPITKNLLIEYGFTEVGVSEFIIYKGVWSVPGGDIPVLIRVEDNYIFAAISGQEAYAETLIKSIYK